MLGGVLMKKSLPDLKTYDFDNILCQLNAICGADPSGLINYQFLSRPTTAKDIAQLFYCVKYVIETQKNLYEEFSELYHFVNDFIESVDLQIDEKIDAALKSNDFIDEVIIPKVRDWISKNMVDIVAETVKQVYFGLTDDGYFVAYIPSSWSDITFSTCVTDDCYGRLILEY